MKPLLGHCGVITITQHEFEALLEYSCSLPTGTQPGKRWKRDNNAFWDQCPWPLNPGDWYMGEYVDLPGEEKRRYPLVQHQHRRIHMGTVSYKLRALAAEHSLALLGDTFRCQCKSNCGGCCANTIGATWSIVWDANGDKEGGSADLIVCENCSKHCYNENESTTHE